MHVQGGQERIAPWYCGHADADKMPLRQETRLQHFLEHLAPFLCIMTLRIHSVQGTISIILLGHATYKSIRGNRRLQATTQMSPVASGSQVQNCGCAPLR
jgi:hypothetical protein